MGGIPPALQIRSTLFRTGFGRNQFEFFRTHGPVKDTSLAVRRFLTRTSNVLIIIVHCKAESVGFEPTVRLRTPR